MIGDVNLGDEAVKLADDCSDVKRDGAEARQWRSEHTPHVLSVKD